jgi:hypothetical protein
VKGVVRMMMIVISEVGRRERDNWELCSGVHFEERNMYHNIKRRRVD